MGKHLYVRSRNGLTDGVTILSIETLLLMRYLLCRTSCYNEPISKQKGVKIKVHLIEGYQCGEKEKSSMKVKRYKTELCVDNKKSDEDIAKQFKTLMAKGEVKNAIRLIETDAAIGILPLNDETKHMLHDKHPVAEPLHEQMLLNEPLHEQMLLNEPLHEQMLLNEPLHEQMLLNEPLHEQMLLNEPLHEQMLLNEPLHEQMLLNEPLHEQMLLNEPLHEQMLLNEPLHEQMLLNEPLHEQMLSNEPYTNKCY